jgi:steroid 5-alpha reductase family enzyme
VLAWIAGFTCEAVADAQLARFRADPNSRGTVLDTGRRPMEYAEVHYCCKRFTLTLNLRKE